MSGEEAFLAFAGLSYSDNLEWKRIAQEWEKHSHSSASPSAASIPPQATVPALRSPSPSAAPVFHLPTTVPDKTLAEGSSTTEPSTSRAPACSAAINAPPISTRPPPASWPSFSPAPIGGQGRRKRGAHSSAGGATSKKPATVIRQKKNPGTSKKEQSSQNCVALLPSTSALQSGSPDVGKKKANPKARTFFFRTMRYEIQENFDTKTAALSQSLRKGRGKRAYEWPTNEAVFVHYLFLAGKLELPLILRGAKMDLVDMENVYNQKKGLCRIPELHSLQNPYTSYTDNLVKFMKVCKKLGLNFIAVDFMAKLKKSNEQKKILNYLVTGGEVQKVSRPVPAFFALSSSPPPFSAPVPCPFPAPVVVPRDSLTPTDSAGNSPLPISPISRSFLVSELLK